MTPIQRVYSIAALVAVIASSGCRLQMRGGAWTCEGICYDDGRRPLPLYEVAQLSPQPNIDLATLHARVGLVIANQVEDYSQAFPPGVVVADWRESLLRGFQAGVVPVVRYGPDDPFFVLVLRRASLDFVGEQRDVRARIVYDARLATTDGTVVGRDSGEVLSTLTWTPSPSASRDPVLQRVAEDALDHMYERITGLLSTLSDPQFTPELPRMFAPAQPPPPPADWSVRIEVGPRPQSLP